MEAWLWSLLQTLSLPEVGLSTLFVVAFLAATFLPMGSEPVLIGLVTLNPSWWWPAVVVATAGNTLGGMVSWGMGYGAHQLVDRTRGTSTQTMAWRWLERWGPKACLLSWLPGVGDPLCAVAGWLKLPFWPCALYMAIGKFGRYVAVTAAVLWAVPADWGLSG